MSTFSCQCQNYRGNLVVTEKEFYFTSSLFRIELEWGNVKRVRLETQQVKGIPTSVLTVVLQHDEAICLQDTSDSNRRKRGSASRKYFFYGFQDLLGTEELVKHYLEQYRAAEKTREKEGHDETDKGSTSTGKRQEKIVEKATERATEKDEVSSFEPEPLKEDSLNMSRSVLPRRPESEPSRNVAPVSFSGRRATTSTVSRPRIPAKILTTASLTLENERHRWMTALFLKVYRYVAVFLVLVMFFVLSRYFSRMVAVTDGRYAMQAAEKLLRDIDALACVTAGLEAYDNQESLWRYNKGRKRLADLSHDYTQRLEGTAVELMERYVTIQAKMATLRGQRVTRVARALQNGVPPPPPPASMSSEFSTPKKGAAAGIHIATTGKDTSASPDSTTFATTTASAAGDMNTCTTARQCTTNASIRAKATASTTAGSAKQQRKKKMSLSELQDDVLRWVRRGKAAWAFVTRFTKIAAADSPTLQPTAAFSSSHSATSLDSNWVVYSEKLGEDFYLTEWVDAAEEEDRHRCLSLTKDLLDTVELTERLFATFTSVFLVDRYRQLASGEERGSYWLLPPHAVRTITSVRNSGEKTTFSGDAMVRMAMLRRFIASIVHNEPLLPNQARRRAAALQMAESVLRYRQEEIALLRMRNRGRTDNTTVLWRILNDMVVAPTTKTLQSNITIPDTAIFLRNSMEELRFWHTHNSAWREHVLTFFTPEEQAEIRSTFSVLVEEEVGGERGLVDLSIRPEVMQWLNLPLFRGLLCFETLPTLHEAVGAASKIEGDKGLEMKDGTNDELEQDCGENETGTSDSRDSKKSSFMRPHKADGVIVLPPPPTPDNTAAAPIEAPESDDKGNEEDADDSAPAAAASVSSPPSPPPRPGPARETTTLPTESNDLWKEVKLRWMADLESFRLAFDLRLASRSARSGWSYRLDVEDRSVVADAAEVRRHLFCILSLVNENYVRYMLPNVMQRFRSFLLDLLPSYSSLHSGKDIYLSAVKRWGKQDPAVQLATAQVTGLAPGTTHDVAGSLLYLILQPPPLLQTSTQSARKTMAAAMVLILFAVVLAVLHFMQ